ncbi:MAG: hypothetical protein IPK93_05125 [Solirubrobacterales bacterium]|nr:hypothetical protein [Solirubrobacterales bacterium]
MPVEVLRDFEEEGPVAFLEYLYEVIADRLDCPPAAIRSSAFSISVGDEGELVIKEVGRLHAV